MGFQSEQVKLQLHARAAGCRLPVACCKSRVLSKIVNIRQSADEHNKNEHEKLPRTETKIETETQLEIEIEIGIGIMQMKLCACARAKLRGMGHRSDCGQCRGEWGALLGGCCRRCSWVPASVRVGVAG